MTVSCIAVIFAVVFFAVGITTVYKGKAADTVTFAVSILVAFVPEGLPSVVTLLLSIAAKRMAKQNVLVKDLQGVETLGVCSYVSYIYVNIEPEPGSVTTLKLSFSLCALNSLPAHASCDGQDWYSNEKPDDRTPLQVYPRPVHRD